MFLKERTFSRTPKTKATFVESLATRKKTEKFEITWFTWLNVNPPVVLQYTYVRARVCTLSKLRTFVILSCVYETTNLQKARSRAEGEIRRKVERGLRCFRHFNDTVAEVVTFRGPFRNLPGNFRPADSEKNLPDQRLSFSFSLTHTHTHTLSLSLSLCLSSAPLTNESIDFSTPRRFFCSAEDFKRKRNSLKLDRG